jgi:hypothetical protein
MKTKPYPYNKDTVYTHRNTRRNTIILPQHPEFKFECKLEPEEWDILQTFKDFSQGLCCREIAVFLAGKYTYSQISSRLGRMEKKLLIQRTKKKYPEIGVKRGVWRRPEFNWITLERGDTYGRTWPRPGVGTKAATVRSRKPRTRKSGGGGQSQRSYATTPLGASVPCAGGGTPAQEHREDPPRSDFQDLW